MRVIISKYSQSSPSPTNGAHSMTDSIVKIPPMMTIIKSAYSTISSMLVPFERTLPFLRS